MSPSRAPPEWLAGFQERFGATLRTPLDASSGTLRPVEQGTGRGLYNRQYWFRLFEVLQGEYPLTARLLGLFPFNLLVQRFAREHPPREWDLRLAGRGFGSWLRTQVSSLPAGLPAAALAEATDIDTAWSEVWMAPEVPAWAPSPEELATLEERFLRASPACRLLEESWPLVALRRTLGPDADARRQPLPPPLPTRQHWMLLRHGEALIQVPLSPVRARLLWALRTKTFGAALAEVEASLPLSEQEALVAHIGTWLAEGLRWGFWVGTADR
ncbi:hypothetical protein CYFUS_008971 [Cystobacter fuscus]|uniref:Putative DNA-binding domain-containing protein n=1 Tax=Cystobacter fuscus TaxID=43 RepID=A0A250JJC4_9BACT|nr:DNA-binding domain-containing protein [Cystobacter fuscus]ATB43491.1 hypothetical protein CYFUS_008971 [Cystobacter fuscus]